VPVHFPILTIPSKVNPLSRRLRSLLLLLLPVLLVGLAGCGSSDSSSSSSASASTGSALDAVAITGDVGKAPQVEWKSKMTASDVQNTTLTKGDGDTVGDGDIVSTQLWIGNGFSQKQAYSSYDQGGAQQLTLNDQLSPVSSTRSRARRSVPGSR